MDVDNADDDEQQSDDECDEASDHPWCVRCLGWRCVTGAFAPPSAPPLRRSRGLSRRLCARRARPFARSAGAPVSIGGGRQSVQARLVGPAGRLWQRWWCWLAGRNRTCYARLRGGQRGDLPYALFLPPSRGDRHLQALAGHPAGIAAFNEAPDEMINFTIAERRKVLPCFRSERGDEVSVLEQQVGGVVQRLPQTRLLCQRDEGEIDDERGECIEPASPGDGSVMLWVLVILMSRFRRGWLGGERGDPYAVEVDEP